MRYAIWNNKGGVGKTYLSYLLATEIAHKHRDKTVLVVDMCPQANVSEILLGGNGRGSEKVIELREQNATVASYFSARMSKNMWELVGTEIDFIHNVYDLRKDGSEQDQEFDLKNLFLVCGDANLELQRRDLLAYAEHKRPEKAWLLVHRLLDGLIDTCARSYDDDLIVIIDCNPSFSIYTEMAITVSDKVIVPCTPDGSSIRAVENVARLIYGYKFNGEHTDYDFSFFGEMESLKALSHLPKLHRFINNRSGTYREAPASSYASYESRLSKLVSALFKDEDKSRLMFSDRHRENLVADLDSNIPDTHRLTQIVIAKGLIFSSLRGTHSVHGYDVQVTKEQKEAYLKSIKSLLAELGF